MTAVELTEQESLWVGNDPAREAVVQEVIEYVQLMKQYKLEPTTELEIACALTFDEIFGLLEQCAPSAQDRLAVARILEQRLRQGIHELSEFRQTLQAL